MPASIGTYGKLGIGSANPVDKRLRYKDEDFVAKLGLMDGNAINGVLDKNIELVRDNEIRVDGPVNLMPNAVELSYLLEWILGGTPSGSGTVTYPLTQTNTLPEKYLTIDRVIKVFTYQGVKVSRATFRATQNGPLELSLDLVGKSLASEDAAGAFPAISLNIANAPFIFRDLVMTVAGTTVKAKEWNLVIDNMLETDRFFNSQTLQSIDQPDRKITFSTSLPYGDYHALKAGFVAAGTAVVATFTNGAAVLSFSLVKVAIPYADPGTPGKSEIMLQAAGEAHSSSTTAALVTTLNPGP
jgi:hypothetical protein